MREGERDRERRESMSVCEREGREERERGIGEGVREN